MNRLYDGFAISAQMYSERNILCDDKIKANIFRNWFWTKRNIKLRRINYMPHSTMHNKQK